ncbi:hypothetical protein OF377_00720 [Ureaplasma sp. ES3154-GEN]|uniref:hypothetical protein n=1 Tax=Ureaplasma sp. ES3154-GEN TaxID=2984844 RepID=UPI0021E9AD62|nr:hypothetical protein [Ureaplasma sp. ES3154-GEN]MCV3743410.1 hypothetical protein [Ureaplasma sp. ES3154-GEN]
MITIDFNKENNSITISYDKLRKNNKGKHIAVRIDNPSEQWNPTNISNFLSLIVDTEEASVPDEENKLDVRLTDVAKSAIENEKIYPIEFIFDLFKTFADKYNNK